MNEGLSNYPRMKYAHERRDWVRAARPMILHYRHQASLKQDSARRLFNYWSSLSPDQQGRQENIWLMVSEEYSDARSLLWRALYYEGMLRANDAEKYPEKE